MPFTFPHFGSLKYVFERVLKELGRNDIIMPHKPSKKTSNLGSRYSPEFICTPFKITLGTFIEGLERGADELGMGGCNAYCRFGYYWPVQKLILEDLGYDFEFIHLNYEDPIEILQTFKNKVSRNYNMLQTIRALRFAWLVNRSTDLIDKLLFKYRALELVKGTAERTAEKAFQKIREVENTRQLKRVHRKLPEFFEKNVEINNDINPIKVAVNGEIYVVIEPSLNLDVFKRLNELGVIVDNPITLRKFIDVPKKLNPFVKEHWDHSIKASSCYHKYKCGGEVQENLGDAVTYKKAGWDGIVHLYPFTCMPEIISRSIFPQVSREHDMPVLSLVVDEQTGEAGFQTRLEAFIDLLKRRKE